MLQESSKVLLYQFLSRRALSKGLLAYPLVVFTVLFRRTCFFFFFESSKATRKKKKKENESFKYEAL